MSNTKTAFAASSKALADAARRRLSMHPSPEELIAYDDGQLEAAQKEHIQNHLALCRECTSTLLDLAAFPNVQCRDEDSADQHVPEWETMQALLHKKKATRMPLLHRPRRSAERRGEFSRFFPAALAASLAVIVGLSLWVQTLNQTVREFSRPRINVYHNDLIPLDEDQVREMRNGQEVTVPQETARFLLILNIGERGSFSDYMVEISDQPGGKVLWSRRGFEPSRYGTFNLELHRDYLPAGRYWLRLHGLDGDRAEILADYQVRIAYE